MNERIYALQSRNASSAKWFAKHMFSYLDFRCYFEANGQNHIHFRLIQVLKNSMAWHFLTFRSLSYKLEFVYIYPRDIAESKSKCSSSTSSLTLGRVNRRVEESVKGSGNSAFLQKDQLCYLKRAEKLTFCIYFS